ncbi:cytochrome-c peroxidase [Rhizobium sp. L1K21]|uniref:cytochrome-c peroxidase n=1 Tax=Rhizobium sp. L1K21 TaxID=2954933 RepID=UPI0020925A31|nr:cytochrome c peroxidase [Rhizobium sp. L1K21]MCO6186742.1 methylamine utilization protein MauG [Rhizobium sp. L1K21]
MKKTVSVSFVCLAIALAAPVAGEEADNGEDNIAVLGQMLFNDVNLSKNRTQACATCHAPDMGFADPRDGAPGRAVSLGDDGHSLGSRNAPTAAYAAHVPPFGKDAVGNWIGGLFLDGRAHSGLEDQAGGPPLNPAEMGMPDKAAVVERLKENDYYVDGLKAAFGDAIFDDTDAAFAAMAKAIAAFERSAEFSTFDSKYDRYLRGEEKLTDQEELGRVLFASTQFTNCNVCHALKGERGLQDSVFSNHRYFNIGVPANPDLAATEADPGLGGVLQGADAAAERGKFRVPTLRNVAVTGPYMHNGVFKDLRTVILFYNKYNSIRKSRQIDPETGKPWAAPEVADNIAMKELQDGPALGDQRIDALVAFLKTLTDRRYEHLLDVEK